MPTLEKVRLRSSSHRLHNLLQRWDCLQFPPDQKFGSFLWSSLIVVNSDCGHLWLWSLHDARFSPLLEHTGAPIPTKYFWRAPPTFGSRARSHKKRSGVQQRCVSSWAWLHGSGIWLFNHNVWLILTSNIFSKTSAIYGWCHIQKGKLSALISIPYLIFVIFFTQAKILENKIYTEKRQFCALNL